MAHQRCVAAPLWNGRLVQRVLRRVRPVARPIVAPGEHRPAIPVFRGFPISRSFHSAAPVLRSPTTPPSRARRSDNDNNQEEKAPSGDSPSLQLKDERLPCAQHLDPDGTLLPTSTWIHVNGTLPICSLDQVLRSMRDLLAEEDERGIIDLSAEWNPVRDPFVPTLPRSGGSSEDAGDTAAVDEAWIEAAHVVLSPFGRPNGWHIKLANRSLANAILMRSQQEYLRVAFKVVQIREYEYSEERQQREDPAFRLNGGLVVDDSMVRIENCPHDLSAEYVRYLLSRYDLAPEGRTVLRWRGRTNDGKKAPLMFVVRFASASWARAAVRELQSTVINDKTIRLVQYPQQMRYGGNESR